MMTVAARELRRRHWTRAARAPSPRDQAGGLRGHAGTGFRGWLKLFMVHLGGRP